MADQRAQLSMFFTDDGFGFVERKPGSLEIENFGEVKLNKGTIKNGYIKEPEILLEKIKSVFKSFKIKAKSVKMVINEQNTILRQLMIPKKDLGSMTIGEYVRSQLGKTIHFPFKTPALDFHVLDENIDAYQVIVFIADESLLHDYHDIFDAMGMTEAFFDLPQLALYKMYYKDDEYVQPVEEEVKEQPVVKLGRRSVNKKIKQEDLGAMEGLMIVTLYDSLISLIVFDKEYPVFSLLEEFDGLENYYDVVESYVSRISNYYKFNMHGGKKAIKQTVFFNFTNKLTDEVIKDELGRRLEDQDYHVFDLEKKSSYYKQILPRGCYMALATNFE